MTAQVDFSKILSHEANTFFGSNKFSYLMNSELLEATLRYIAIKECDGDLSRCDSLIWHDDGTQEKIFGICYDPTLSYPGEGWESLNVLDNDETGRSFAVDKYLENFDRRHNVPTRCYYNPAKKATKIVIAEATTTPTYIQGVCTSLFWLLKWIFNSQEKIDEYKDFFKTISLLGSKNIDKSTGQCMGDLAAIRLSEVFGGIVENLCFQEYAFKMSLKGWAYNDIENKKKKCEKQIQNYLDSIQEYDYQMRDAAKKCNEQQQLLLLYDTISKDDNSVYDFFASIKECELVEVDNSILVYKIKTQLRYYDEDELENIMNTKLSWYARYSELAKAVVRGLFKYKYGMLNTYAVFGLESITNVSAFGESSGYYEPEYEEKNAIPNTHIYYYRCLGTNASQITQLMARGNWKGAIMQTIYATQNISFGDGTVMTTFGVYINKHLNDISCIQMDDGRLLTFNEFGQYVLKKEAENE